MSRLLSAILILFSLASAPVQAGDPVWNYEESDPAMSAAISDARATLQLFDTKMMATDLEKEVMLLKVAIPHDDTGGVEHIWCAVQGHEGESYRGYISNAPVYIDYAQYDQISWTKDDVSDWTYWENGLMEGAYTVRVMLPDLPKADADNLRAQLAPLPEA